MHFEVVKDILSCPTYVNLIEIFIKPGHQDVAVIYDASIYVKCITLLLSNSS